MGITAKQFREIFSQIGQKRFVVIGDFILDHFVWGCVDRISPEAPVPVVNVSNETYRLGGALNVAANFVSLGAQVTAIGALGTDFEAESVRRICYENHIQLCAVADEAIRTLRKTRIIAASQQVVRVDRNEREELPSPVPAEITNTLLREITSADGIVLSDYGKGVLSKPVLKAAITAAGERNIPSVVDPKPERFWDYAGATLMTPNTKETGQAVGRKLRTQEDICTAGKEILERLKLKALLITRGEQGMALFMPADPPEHIQALAREVYDVTGAGDTVTTTAAAALALGAPPAWAARIANAAAGVAVGKIGTSTVKLDEIAAQLDV